MHSMLYHFMWLLLLAKALLEKEIQLRRELEERLSEETSSTERPSKDVATGKVLTLLPQLLDCCCCC